MTLALVLILGALFGGCGGGRQENPPPVSSHKKSAAVPANTADLPAPTAGGTTRIPPLTPRSITLQNGRQYTLNVPAGMDIHVAAQGLKRVRFMAQSPDGRIFVTDMFDKTDNRKGSVYILENFDTAQKKFLTVRKYLDSLHNPNSVGFYTEPSGGKQWLYVALTGQLVRYPYTAGDTAPSGSPQILATFPDYGLSYKYGGWHLTRTIAFSPAGKLYVSVGSSCNACEEKEEVRAAVLEMNPDGTAQRFYARGLRNAVGLRFVGHKLYCTNMGSDHLGDDKPEDQMIELKDGANYGWPYCYQYRRKIYADPLFAGSDKKILPKDVPVATIGFLAHSAPLGLEWFPKSTQAAYLRDCFLVGLHGSTKEKLHHGYCVALVREGKPPLDLINGFLQGLTVQGRPCDVLRLDDQSFLITDDFAGVIYYLTTALNIR